MFNCRGIRLYNGGLMPNSTTSDFAAMDNAGITSHHWKIMLISGMGFFTDAYDLFIIGVVMALLKPIWHVGKLEESLVASTALLAAAFGALLFGRAAFQGQFARCGDGEMADVQSEPYGGSYCDEQLRSVAGKLRGGTPEHHRSEERRVG